MLTTNLGNGVWSVWNTRPVQATNQNNSYGQRKGV